MNCPSVHRFCSATIAALAAACAAACVVPLAPGYQIEKESIAVRYLADSPPRLAVRAEYRLANVGTAPLDSIEIGLPGQESFGRGNLRVEINGGEVAPQLEHGEEAEEGESAASETWPTIWRIPFSPGWHRKQKRDLLIEYDLAPQNAHDSRISVGPKAFYLNDSGWFPDPLTPRNLFAKDVVRPDPSELLVDVPSDFVGTASGEARGVEKKGGEILYRFRLRKDNFAPFVVAGRYQQQTIATPDGPIVLWTFTPQPPGQARRLAMQIAAARRFLEGTFGLLPQNMKAIGYVESFPESSTGAKSWGLSQRAILPGVVFDSFLSPERGFRTCLGNALSPDLGQFELAYTWFGHLITPRPEAWFLSGILADYASDLIQEDVAGGIGRGEQITSLLQDYDDDRKQAVEKPIMSLAPSDPEEQLEIGAAKSQLFLFALEDRCGREKNEQALAHLIYALRGGEYGYEDFRAALEQECHQSLGEFFRAWLTQAGIPPEFRARYSASPETKSEPRRSN